MIAVRVDLFFSDPDPQPDMPAADYRLMAVVGAYIETQPAAGFGESVAGFVQSVAGGSAYPDGNFPTVRHGRLLYRFGDSLAFRCKAHFEAVSFERSSVLLDHQDPISRYCQRTP